MEISIISNLILVVGFWFIGYFLLEKYFKQRQALLNMQNHIAINANSYGQSLKLTALEKFTILLNRVQMANLVGRTYQHGMTVKELESALILTVFKEYEFNASQQLYVSDQLWEILTFTKQEILNFISNSAEKFPDEASGEQLYNFLLNHYSSDTDLCRKALAAVKAEGQYILS